MNKLFYPKMAVMNIRKNGKFYLPYLLTCAGMTAMFYIMCTLIFHSGLSQMPSSATLQSILAFGAGIVAIFSAVFLFYASSFLMKRRQKELGLYNILGMEKRHIGKILFFESLILWFVTGVLGILSGMILNKLILLLLCRMLQFSTPLSFEVQPMAIALTIAIFAAIFLLIFLFSLIQLARSKPIELLRASGAGEREPKTKAVMAVLGLLCLGAGYWIAITVESPLKALTLFFIAVLLVIVGTYLLFTAGSIALLKLLRRHKNYYYKAKHFTAVSGMIYRMKQNAAGLASICILSTMVLVMVSTTVSMYVGMEDILKSRFPTELSVTVPGADAPQQQTSLQKIQNTVAEQGRTIDNLSYYEMLSFSTYRNGNSFDNYLEQDLSSSSITTLNILTAEEYNRLTGKSADLSGNNILIYLKDEQVSGTITILGQPFTVAENLADSPLEIGSGDIASPGFIIVSDASALAELNELQQQTYGDYASDTSFYVNFDIDGTSEEKIACYDAVSDAVKQKVTTTVIGENGEETVNYYTSYVESKEASKQDFYSLYGGLLFLGLFLGLLFLIATVLIIYYKQISEGYDDRTRFEIMQKVGMSHAEIRATIRSQVLKVFFIPIAMAGIHILMAFRMITRLLTIFNLTNVALFAVCTAATLVAFALIYAMVYAMTAKVYYKIVS